MKTFNTLENAFLWIGDIVEESESEAKAIIAEQIYKDSDKYTYRETGEMYDSGILYSDFKNGFVVERKPQVRFLYYAVDVNAGDGNRNAIPQWFERTKTENMPTYKKMYGKIIEQEKR